jgi:transposase
MAPASHGQRGRCCHLVCAMAETCRRFDHDFREGALRLVRETGKPTRRWRGIWESMRAPRATGAKLAMECDVLKRSLAPWVKDAMRR